MSTRRWSPTEAAAHTAASNRRRCTCPRSTSSRSADCTSRSQKRSPAAAALAAAASAARRSTCPHARRRARPARGPERRGARAGWVATRRACAGLRKKSHLTSFSAGRREGDRAGVGEGGRGVSGRGRAECRRRARAARAASRPPNKALDLRRRRRIFTTVPTLSHTNALADRTAQSGRTLDLLVATRRPVACPGSPPFRVATPTTRAARARRSATRRPPSARASSRPTSSARGRRSASCPRRSTSRST